MGGARLEIVYLEARESAEKAEDTSEPVLLVMLEYRHRELSRAFESELLFTPQPLS